MLEEPSSGMVRSEREHVARMLVRMNKEFGLTLVLIEHDARFVLEHCDQVVALDFGYMVAAGTAEAVFADPKVIEAYLGTKTETPAVGRAE